MANKVAKINKIKVIGARVSESTLSSLEKIATKENRTISNLVGIWITERLEKESKLKKAG